MVNSNFLNTRTKGPLIYASKRETFPGPSLYFNPVKWKKFQICIKFETNLGPFYNLRASVRYFRAIFLFLLKFSYSTRKQHQKKVNANVFVAMEFITFTILLTWHIWMFFFCSFRLEIYCVFKRLWRRVFHLLGEKISCRMIWASLGLVFDETGVNSQPTPLHYFCLLQTHNLYFWREKNLFVSVSQ